MSTGMPVATVIRTPTMTTMLFIGPSPPPVGAAMRACHRRREKKSRHPRLHKRRLFARATDLAASSAVILG
jgi:hypothetical protein